MPRRATVPQIEFDQAMVDIRQGGLNFSRVLFLDIDGVLHPSVPDVMSHFCFARNFYKAVRRADPQAAMPVVISSDWKFHHTLLDLRMRFSPDLAQQIVGVTPDHSGRADETREGEITTWMARHAGAGDWLAIDDTPQWFRPGCNNLFVVEAPGENGLGGLHARHCDEMEARLRAFLVDA